LCLCLFLINLYWEGRFESSKVLNLKISKITRRKEEINIWKFQMLDVILSVLEVSWKKKRWLWHFISRSSCHVTKQPWKKIGLKTWCFNILFNNQLFIGKLYLISLHDIVSPILSKNIKQDNLKHEKIQFLEAPINMAPYWILSHLVFYVKQITGQLSFFILTY
jgi:hypothetical protein